MTSRHPDGIPFVSHPCSEDAWHVRDWCVALAALLGTA